MIHRDIENRLRRMGLTCCYQGYICLVYAAVIACADPETLAMPTKLIYPKVARLCRLTPGGVDQAIRTAIQVCCRRDPELVARMCGTSAPSSAQLFLAGLAGCCTGRQR